jgi:hypothetical protein
MGTDRDESKYRVLPSRADLRFAVAVTVGVGSIVSFVVDLSRGTPRDPWAEGDIRVLASGACSPWLPKIRYDWSGAMDGSSAPKRSPPLERRARGAGDGWRERDKAGVIFHMPSPASDPHFTEPVCEFGTLAAENDHSL